MRRRVRRERAAKVKRNVEFHVSWACIRNLIEGSFDDTVGVEAVGLAGQPGKKKHRTLVVSRRSRHDQSLSWHEEIDVVAIQSSLHRFQTSRICPKLELLSLSREAPCAKHEREQELHKKKAGGQFVCA